MPLTLAARYKNPDIVGMLLDAGAEISRANEDGYASLMEAADCVVSDSLRLLIQRSAEVNSRSQNGSTPLIYGVLLSANALRHPHPMVSS